jgi:quercetin dioxygenase-like cupin family protein
VSTHGAYARSVPAIRAAETILLRIMTRSPLLKSLAVVAVACIAHSAIEAQQPDVSCVPVSERGQRETGCFITAREELGALPASPALYWHIDTYASAAAANAAKGARGTVVESLGKPWLFTIAPQEWRATGGQHVTTIGPLALVDAKAYAAVYMEGVFNPGMTSMTHRHPGVEVFYTLEGSMCLETPEGKFEQRAGDPGLMVNAGLPMHLLGTGTGARKSLVLILQDAALPRSVPATDWTPKGLCRAATPSP